MALAQELQTQEMSLQLGDFSSKAQLSYPSNAGGKVPAVLLIHGSTPEDMGGSIVGPDGKVISSIFGQIAQGLGARGIAVLRYNKRYVSGPGQADTAKFYQLTLKDFLADAQVALNALRQDTHIDPKRIFVYGWSEGSVVAAQLVLQNPDLRGLIVQGPVVRPYVQLFREQFSRVGVPYMQTFAQSGRIGLEGLLQAIRGNGGLLARSQVSFMFDQTSTPQNPKLSRYVDQNHDGLIDLEAEAIPAVNAFYQDTPRAVGIYATSLALPVLQEVAPRLKLPVLILQGQNDANIPATDARLLFDLLQKSGGQPTLRIYSGLGHSLGKASSPTEDNFRPIEGSPIADLVEWIQQH